MSLPDPPPPPEPRLVTAGVHQVATEESAVPAVAPPPPVETGRQYSFRHIETGELTHGTVTCSERHLAANTPHGYEAVTAVAERAAPARPEMDSDIHRRIDQLETMRRITERAARRSPAKLSEVVDIDDQIEAEIDKLEARRAIKAQRQSAGLD